VAADRSRCNWLQLLPPTIETTASGLPLLALVGRRLCASLKSRPPGSPHRLSL
jgi:hypothetical protein